MINFIRQTFHAVFPNKKMYRFLIVRILYICTEGKECFNGNIAQEFPHV